MYLIQLICPDYNTKAMKEMKENIAIGVYAFKNATTASRCICLGPEAGEDIIDEDYQFRFSTNALESRTEFCTTMTEEEWKVVHAVVSRALKNGKRGVFEANEYGKIEDEKQVFMEWMLWKDTHERILAKREINNLTSAIQVNEIYKKIVEKHGVSVGHNVDKLKTEKKDREKAYRDKYGEGTAIGHHSTKLNDETFQKAQHPHDFVGAKEGENITTGSKAHVVGHRPLQ